MHTRIIPSTSNAPETIAVIIPIGPLIASTIASELRATAETRDAAPAIIIPTPIGILPTIQRIIPSARSAPPAIPIIKDNHAAISSGAKAACAATDETISAPPAIIIPIAMGVPTTPPIQSKIIPKASKAPPATPIIVVSI